MGFCCRSQLASGIPDSVDNHSPSSAAEDNGSPSHPADMSPTLPQQQPHLFQSPLQPQGNWSAETPSPPSTGLTNGTSVPQPSSSPVSIPSGSPPQPSSEHAPESSSAPSDLRGHVHRWAKHTSNSQEDSPAALHQLPQASPSCHFEQGSASNEGHHAARRPALHGSRSSRAKADSGAGHGHGIKWNDSRDSLLSSHEDLAQLVPDRASKGGVEQAPEVASFTGRHLCALCKCQTGPSSSCIAR